MCDLIAHGQRFQSPERQEGRGRAGNPIDRNGNSRGTRPDRIEKTNIRYIHRCWWIRGELAVGRGRLWNAVPRVSHSAHVSGGCATKTLRRKGKVGSGVQAAGGGGCEHCSRRYRSRVSMTTVITVATDPMAPATTADSAISASLP